MLRNYKPEDYVGVFPTEAQEIEFRRFLIAAGLAKIDAQDVSRLVDLVMSDPAGQALLLRVGSDPIDQTEALIAYFAARHSLTLRYPYMYKIRRVLHQYLGRYLTYPTSGGGLGGLPVSPNLGDLLKLGDPELVWIIHQSLERDLAAIFAQDEAKGQKALMDLLDQGGTAELDDLLLGLASDFDEALSLSIPGLRAELDGNSFPSRRQRLFIARFGKRDLILAHGPGGGKTATALACFALYGLRCLFISPAGVIDQTAKRPSKYFRSPPVCIVATPKDLLSLDERAQIHQAEIVFVAYDSLITRIAGGKNTAERQFDPLSDLGHFLAEGEFDLVIADEAHVVRNPDSTVSRAFQAIVRNLSCRILPITATPMYSTPADMQVLAHLMQPERFPAIGDFAAAVDLNPDAVRIHFVRGRVDFAETEELVPLPPWDYAEEITPRKLTIGPAQRAIYQYLERLPGLGLDPLRKIQLLRQATIQPAVLVKAEATVGRGEERKQVKIGPELDWHWAALELDKAYEQFCQNWQSPVFNEDWLVSNRFSRLMLAAHFNLEAGMFELITRIRRNDVLADFESAPLSIKFAEVVKICEQALADNWNVVVVSAMFRRGIVAPVNGEEEWDQEDLLAYRSLVKLLRTHFDEPNRQHVLAFDAELSAAKREEMRDWWKVNPQWRIAVLSPASSQGIEMPVLQEKGVQGQLVIRLDRSYEPGKEEQIDARCRRPDQKVPGKTILLECQRTIDVGCRYHLAAKEENIRVLRYGRKLTAEQMAIQRNEPRATFSALSWWLKRPGHRVGLLFNTMRSQDSSANRRLLNETNPGASDISLGALLAESHLEYQDQGGLPAFSTNLLASLLTAEQQVGHLDRARVADIGSATLGLQRALPNWPIVSFDFCLEMLATGRAATGLPGRLVGADAVRLPLADHSLSGAVLSLILDQVTPQQRLEILTDLRRIVDGRLYLVSSAKMLDREHYRTWLTGLTQLGWRVREERSGYVTSSERGDKNLGLWLIVMENSSRSAKETDWRQFLYAFEKPRQMDNGVRIDKEKLPKPELEEEESWGGHFIITDPTNNRIRYRL